VTLLANALSGLDNKCEDSQPVLDAGHETTTHVCTFVAAASPW